MLFGANLGGGTRRERGPPSGMPASSMSSPLKERIPAKYNADSELTVDVVKTGGGNAFDFALNGRPGT